MNERNKTKDWGKGIPNYDETDLMTKEEIHDFGVEIVAGQLYKEGYKIHIYNPTYGSFPSIVAENENEVVAVAVLTDIAKKQPILRMTDKFGILGYCDGFPTKPCFASVSIGSTDPERFEKEIALRGDGFYANYTGLEYLSKELPEVNSEEYKAFVMQYLGGYLRAGNFEAIEDYIADDCIIENSLNKKVIEEKTINFIKNTFSKNRVINHCVIKSVGDIKNIKVDKLYVKGNIEGENVNVKLLQESDKIGLLIKTQNDEFNIGDNGIIFNVDFNVKGKINKIEFIDPRLYSFNAYN